MNYRAVEHGTEYVAAPGCEYDETTDLDRWL